VGETYLGNVADVGKDWKVMLQGWTHVRAPPPEGDLHVKMKCKGSHLGTASQKCIRRQQVKRRKLKLWWLLMSCWYNLSLKNVSIA